MNLNKKNYKVGDTITTELCKLSLKEKVIVKGKIKKIENGFGMKSYVITKGVVEDFSTRKVK